MTLQLHFKTFVKNNQTRKLSKTWHAMIAEREVIRNNYQRNGDMRKAKQFATSVRKFQFEKVNRPIASAQPTVIFSKDMVDTSFSLLNYLH